MECIQTLLLAIVMKVTLPFCGVLYVVNGGGGGRGDITSLVLSTEMTSDDNVDRPP